MLKLFRSGILSELNFFCIHSYCVQPELNYPQTVSLLRRTLDSSGGSHVELWQGEGGYASCFPEKHWLPPYVLKSERNQAVWMLRRYFMDFSSGLKVSSFFQMADMTNNYQTGDKVRKNPAQHGILDGVDYTPKLSYRTMQHLTAFFRNGMKAADLYCGTILENALPRNERHSRLADIAVKTNTFIRDGHPFFEYHLAEDMQYGFPGISSFAIDTEIRPGLKAIKDPVLLDMLTGRILRIENWQIDVYGEICSFRDLPLTDYPLVVCDAKALP